MSKGIDYGMGMANVDRETGIRFGVIPMHALDEWAWESFETDYGSPACPKCGGDVVDSDGVGAEQFIDAERDWYCCACNRSFWSDSVYGEEALGWTLDNGEYLAEAHQDGDCFVLRSPYFTRAAFCSPCAPGACYLTSPCEDGERAYCFGHDCFDGDVAPYPVWSVATGELVAPPTK